MPKSTGKLLINSNRSKCVVCGEVFSTERNFDLHRTGSYSNDRKCLDPQTVGLQLVGTSTGSVWKGKFNGESKDV